ncbi:MAG: HDIG domain-containing protein [bacterium]|nr:HDIG domain-containing protein [bacterium]
MKEKFDPINKKTIEERERFESMTETKKEEHIDELHERALLENVLPLRQKAESLKNKTESKDLNLVADIAELIRDKGGLALIVGGYARDEVLNESGYELEPKDLDLEIYGISSDELQEILKTFGDIDEVGAQFQVTKLTLETGTIIDVALPRRDSKTGRGHKGFKSESDIEMTIEDAARRRDFTINALGLDPLTGEIIDKFGGLEDIRNKKLRAIDPKTFIEDPLRVLRAAQFAGRFGFGVDDETAELCRSLDLKELPGERLGEEWRKLLLKSPKPSIGLEVARELGIIEKLHPELEALIGTPQDPKYHPEGDVWEHTKLSVDAAALIVCRQKLSEDEAFILLFTALCHDLGKPITTKKTDEGKIISHEHASAGVKPTKKMMASLRLSSDIVEKVSPLVEEHMFPLTSPNPSDSAVRRLAKRLGKASILELVMVSEADSGGRGKILKSFPEGEALLAVAARLEVLGEAPKPILMGRDLIEIGFTPGHHFGEVLRSIYDEQLDGKIKTLDEAKVRAKEIYHFIK